MKVGTDGILLGAWTNIDKDPENILDIGAGTGLIALMLAQRSAAFSIDAIEIEPNAYEQCVENFEASPWADRLFCYHCGLEEFVAEMDEKYDLIVCNPPYFNTEVQGRDAARESARNNQFLPYPQLIKAASELLSESGTLNIIIPIESEEFVLKEAKRQLLFPGRITRVRSLPDKPYFRSLISFQTENGACIEEELTLENRPGTYSDPYIDLTKAFYHKM